MTEFTIFLILMNSSYIDPKRISTETLYFAQRCLAQEKLAPILSEVLWLTVNNLRAYAVKQA